MRISYTPISKHEATRQIHAITGIEPVWAVPTWSAARGDWQVLCCAVPGSPDGRLAIAIYEDGALVRRLNVAA